jgi:hypothetical protein
MPCQASRYWIDLQLRQITLDRHLDSANLTAHPGREPSMTASASLHKRKTLHLVILFIAFSAFTADILDLREELYILSCPYSILDNNVSTGLTSNHPFELEYIITLSSVQREAAVNISFMYLLSYGYRAPPSSWS